MPTNKHHSTFSLPYFYNSLFPVLWVSISKALRLCLIYKKYGLQDRLVETNPDLIKCFAGLAKIRTKADKHIVEGLFESHQDRNASFPRVLKLTLRAFKDAQRINANGKTVIIPSPLNIIYNLFIIPEDSYTAAYSINGCRNFLFEALQVSPCHPKKQGTEPNLVQLRQEHRLFTEEDLATQFSDFEKFEGQNGRWPKDTLVDPKSFIHGNVRITESSDSNRRNVGIETTEIKCFLGHFLATKGIAHLWFKNGLEARWFLKFSANEQLFTIELRNRLRGVRFRRSERYSDFPEPGAIFNQVFGFPIPMKGADVVFFGGLKPSANGGLVISVSGGAGAGKTSFALGLANAYSGFGTPCFYISLEEEISDIKRRLTSLRPHAQNRLSFCPKKNDWFSGEKIEGTVSIEDFTKDILSVAERLEKINSGTDLIIPRVCPYIIVIDNTMELAEANGDRIEYKKIEAFIETCRKLNSIVILLNPESVPEKLKIDYLIDIGVKLVHKYVDNEDEKPVRVFHLFKTRHQLSRQGSHIFHMSGPEGFRISPQIPSQIDRKERIRRNLSDQNRVIHTFNYLNDHRGEKGVATIDELKKISGENNLNRGRELFINLFPRTQILIHGYGSAGKAGLALKILLTPPVERGVRLADLGREKFEHQKYQRKVLIISFLYPEQYYEELVAIKKAKGLQGIISGVYGTDLPDPIIDYLVLYPGYLGPQDFLNKLTRKMDEADLRGEPFTGVLIDGLHNVFLQFEKLQDSSMVWPMFYSILSRYDVTVISTFTNFSLNDKLIDSDQSKNQQVTQAIGDHMLMQKGMAPFLHALVKASDFYFFMEQHPIASGAKKYLLAVKSAIGQHVPEEFLEWSREKCHFTNVYTQTELLKMESDSKAIG